MKLATGSLGLILGLGFTFSVQGAAVQRFYDCSTSLDVEMYQVEVQESECLNMLTPSEVGCWRLRGEIDFAEVTMAFDFILDEGAAAVYADGTGYIDLFWSGASGRYRGLLEYNDGEIENPVGGFDADADADIGWSAVFTNMNVLRIINTVAYTDESFSGVSWEVRGCRVLSRDGNLW